MFDLHSLSASSSQAVSAWFNRNCTATVKGEVDRHSKELQRQLDDLSEGDSPKIDSYLVEWGLGVKVAASLTRNHAIHLSAACHVIAHKLHKGHHAMFCVLLVFMLAHLALGHDSVVKELLHWTPPLDHCKVCSYVRIFQNSLWSFIATTA